MKDTEYIEYLQIKNIIENNNYEKAKQKLKEIKNNSTITKFGYAKFLINNNKIEEAREELKEISKGKDSEYAIFELAKLEIREFNYSKAEKYFKYLLETKRNSRQFAMLELGKIEILKENYDEARICFESARENNNEYALLELAKLDLLEGKKEESEIKLNKLIENSSERNVYAYKELSYIYIREKEYKKAKDYFMEYLDNIDVNEETESQKKEIIKAKKFFECKIYDKKENDTYFIKQIGDYSKESCINHIKKHLKKNIHKRSHTTFYNDDNLDDIYNKVLNNLSKNNPIAMNLTNKYCMHFDEEIGECNGIKTSSVEVVTTPDMLNILTIYPIISPTPYKDRKIITLNKIEEKTKKLSQIDKFYKKYGTK